MALGGGVQSRASSVTGSFLHLLNSETYGPGKLSQEHYVTLNDTVVFH